MTRTKEYKQAYGSSDYNEYRDEPVREQPRGNKRSGGGGYVQKVTNDEREEEMDENLE